MWPKSLKLCRCHRSFVCDSKEKWSFCSFCKTQPVFPTLPHQMNLNRQQSLELASFQAFSVVFKNVKIDIYGNIPESEFSCDRSCGSSFWIATSKYYNILCWNLLERTFPYLKRSRAHMEETSFVLAFRHRNNQNSKIEKLEMNCFSDVRERSLNKVIDAFNCACETEDDQDVHILKFRNSLSEWLYTESNQCKIISKCFRMSFRIE